MKIDKSLFKDAKGRYMTQGLFFEFAHNKENACFTIDGQDKSCENNQAVRPLISLKRLYLEMEDPHEYEFASTYLYDWEHWMRICDNKVLGRHIDKWREELEIKIRSAGFQKILDKMEEGDIQATKYVADRGWDKRVGRPSKAEKQREDNIQQRIEDEFSSDVVRLKGIE